MSGVVREERSALPAIGEDTKTQEEMAALLDALHDDSTSGFPVGVRNIQDTGEMMLPRIHIRPVVRRRFHSSDLILRSHGNHHRSGAHGVHSPYANAPTAFADSPTIELRRWVLSRMANGHSNYVNQSNNDPDLSELRRYRSQRRTLSETFTKFVPFDNNLGPIEACHDDDEDDRDERESEEEMIRLLLMKTTRRPSDEYSVSSASSMYSSPGSASTPHSHTRSFGVEYHQENESYDKLRNLQKLYQEGFITVTEYKDRRLQLVDELSIPERTIAKATDLISTDLPIVYREPPDFTLLRERDAIKHIFDSEQRKWTSARIRVKIDTEPFARGGLRQVFHMQDWTASVSSSSDKQENYVAKVAINPNENPDTYFRDVEMQAVASKFAKLYNSYSPPRRVEFLEAWILQLMPSGEEDASDITLRGTICGVEPFIAGEYHKHNNNFGFVSDLERNTPQAFSHFTYEASGHQILVVDIQGVGDHYTDPQIHTRRGKEFGKGNLSIRGFERFLESHRCNPICRYLKLPLNNPKDEPLYENGGDGPVDPKGTIPAQPYMNQPGIRVNRVDSELCHYYGESKAFKRYQSRNKISDQGAAAADSDQSGIQHFVQAMKAERNCASWCGLNNCKVS